jgi:cell division protein FtsN
VILQYVNASSAAESENVLQSVNSTKTVYRVVAGSYSSRENAEKHALQPKNPGVETFIAAYQL